MSHVTKHPITTATFWSLIGLAGALVVPAGAQESTRMARDLRRSAMADLITGPIKNVQSAVAGGATMKVYFTPAPEGGTASNYPPGSTIVGQQLLVPAGTAFNAIIIHQLEDWDPDGNGLPLLRGWEVVLDSDSFLGANALPPNPGCNLVYPNNTVTCPSTTDAECAAKLTAGSRCQSGICKWGYQDTSRPDWVLQPVEPEAIDVVNQVAAEGPHFAGTCGTPIGVVDGHGLYYGGTLALGVPACATGTYTLNFDVALSFAFDPDIVEFPIAEFIPAVITFPGAGSCCYGIGTPGHGCSDGTLQVTCDSLPSPSAWVAGGTCANDCAVGSCCHGIGTPGQACDDYMIEGLCGDDEPAPFEWTEGGSCAVECVFGSCCYGIDTPAEGCVDDVTEPECGDDEPAPSFWTEGGDCAIGCGDSGTAFSYRGYLEKDGAPINGTADLIVSLWNDDDTGAQVGPDFPALALDVTDGVFHYSVGFWPLGFRWQPKVDRDRSSFSSRQWCIHIAHPTRAHQPHADGLACRTHDSRNRFGRTGRRPDQRRVRGQ